MLECEGAQLQSQDYVRTLVNSSRVDVVCLQETKMTKISRGTILSVLGSNFSHFTQLPSVGASGGILLAWKHNLGPAATVRIDNHCISVQFNPSDGHAWWFTGVYGSQGDDNKLQFLQELRDVRAACQGPWLVMGYFNLIVKADDKNNDNLNRAMMGKFHHLINDLELHDVP
jgi:exonuclease III